MIPKIIHQVWPGDDPAPTDLTVRIRRLHPDWKYYLWRPPHIPTLENEILFRKTDIYCLKSNIVRFEMLLKYGGFYADMDWICCKPFDPMLTEPYIITQEFENDTLIADYFIGCEPGWWVMQEAVDTIKRETSKLLKCKHASEIPPIAGSGMLRRIIKGKNVTVQPASDFNPYPSQPVMKAMGKHKATHLDAPGYGYHLYCHFTRLDE